MPLQLTCAPVSSTHSLRPLTVIWDIVLLLLLLGTRECYPYPYPPHRRAIGPLAADKPNHFLMISQYLGQRQLTQTLYPVLCSTFVSTGLEVSL